MSNQRLTRLYFETSALNGFAGTRNVQDAIATKAFQNVRGRGFYLSPVVLWEILLTSDEVNRESLLCFAQHLCEPDLLPSPEELIIRYIETGCPATEAEYPLISVGSFASSWRDICENKEKTLIVNGDDIAAKTKILRDVGRLVHVFSQFQAIDISGGHGISGLQVTIQQVLDRYGLVPAEHRNSADTLRHLRLVTFLIILFVCAGASIEGHLIEQFWEEKGARSVQERIDVVFTHFPQLVLRGPFHQISYMTQFQSGSSFSRGLFFDSLHAVYTLYADIFLSADEHFRSFRNSLQHLTPSVQKIFHLDEVKFTSVHRENPPSRSIFD